MGVCVHVYMGEHFPLISLRDILTDESDGGPSGHAIGSSIPQ